MGGIGIRRMKEVSIEKAKNDNIEECDMRKRGNSGKKKTQPRKKVGGETNGGGGSKRRRKIK